MVTVPEVARIWHDAGVSVIPIRADATKRPALTEWKPYTRSLPELSKIGQWWGNGAPYGIAIICGQVSGGLEMTEIEGRALTPASQDSLNKALNAVPGAIEVWEYLNSTEGFSEFSPSGGLHLLYLVGDHDVPGNTKIAQGEKDENGNRLCLAETRGEGGYVIVAPSPGACHPSGEPWQLHHGEYGRLPIISWEQRAALHEALRLALDQTPPPPEPPPNLPAPRPRTGLSPGDDFELRTDWSDQLLLGGAGWQLHSGSGHTRYWTRPGKERRDGISATTGRDEGRDRLYVFSTSTPFEAETPYNKFGAYAVLHHHGDHHKAAVALTKLGFGSRPEPLPDLPELPIEDTTLADKNYEPDETGNANRLRDRIRNRYLYVYETRHFMRWDGRVWVNDSEGRIFREVEEMTRDMIKKAVLEGNEAAEKWARSTRSRNRTNATIELLKSREGVTVQVADFDKEHHLINVMNGILNLDTGELDPWRPEAMMTRMAAVAYDPGATCPEFEAFMAEALPEEDMRLYVQRCLGYSLLGDADQRCLFLIFGPSGTGKSTLIETIRMILGDYAVTAPPGTFKLTRDKSPTNDLHRLRGKRFVATSETADSTTFDEDLLKRITGRDEITSRALYQEYEAWTPECSIWIATNHPPRFNSDDDAIWRRAKMIPFLTQFIGDAERPDMARRVLLPEASGIFNWMLEGLRQYRQSGLGEPPAISAAAREHRLQSDSVARFIEDKLADGHLVRGEDQWIQARALHSLYMDWARSCGEKALMNRRFHNRMTSVYPEITLDRVGNQVVWRGIGVAAMKEVTFWHSVALTSR